MDLKDDSLTSNDPRNHTSPNNTASTSPAVPLPKWATWTSSKTMEDQGQAAFERRKAMSQASRSPSLVGSASANAYRVPAKRMVKQASPAPNEALGITRTAVSPAASFGSSSNAIPLNRTPKFTRDGKDWNEAASAASEASARPTKKDIRSTIPCRYWRVGEACNVENCPYLHPEPIEVSRGVNMNMAEARFLGVGTQEDRRSSDVKQGLWKTRQCVPYITNSCTRSRETCGFAHVNGEDAQVLLAEIKKTRRCPFEIHDIGHDKAACSFRHLQGSVTHLSGGQRAAEPKLASDRQNDYAVQELYQKDTLSASAAQPSMCETSSPIQLSGAWPIDSTEKAKKGCTEDARLSVGLFMIILLIATFVGL